MRSFHRFITSSILFDHDYVSLSLLIFSEMNYEKVIIKFNYAYFRFVFAFTYIIKQFVR